MKKTRIHYTHPYRAICKNCTGEGIIVEEIPNTRDETKTITCPICEGTGMVEMTKKIILTVKSYKPMTTKK